MAVEFVALINEEISNTEAFPSSRHELKGQNFVRKISTIFGMMVEKEWNLSVKLTNSENSPALEC